MTNLKKKLKKRIKKAERMRGLENLRKLIWQEAELSNDQFKERRQLADETRFKPTNFHPTVDQKLF